MEDEETLINFIDEAREHVARAEPDLLALEANPTDLERIHRLFRGIHSIKGAAGFLGLDTISALTHQMESLLGRMRSGQLTMNAAHLDALLAGLDKLKQLLEDVRASNAVDISAEHSALADLLTDVPGGSGGQTVAPENNPLREFAARARLHAQGQAALQGGQPLYALFWSVREHFVKANRELLPFLDNLETLGQLVCQEWLSVAPTGEDSGDIHVFAAYSTVLDPGMLQTALELEPSQFVAIPPDPMPEAPRPAGSAEPAAGASPARMEGGVVGETLRVSVTRLNKLLNLAGELVLNRNRITQAAREFKGVDPDFENSLLTLGGIITELQEEVMNTRMQPLSLLFGKYPRILRDLCRELQKEIRMEIHGEDVEIDKTVVEALSDPLTHIIRNSADHGIECPKDRENCGKPRQGFIRIRAFHESGMVQVEVRDDGAGIDPEKVARKALEKKIVTPEMLGTFTRQEKVALVFAPGFSTAEKISTVSGRGVGMDVVKANIDKIGGFVSIDSEPGHGTAITMSLPLTLAIVPSLIVMAAGMPFIIPQVNLEELTTIDSLDLHQKILRIQGKDVFHLRNQLLPLYHLADMLGVERHCTHPDTGEIQAERRCLYSERRHDSAHLETGGEPAGGSMQDGERRQGVERRRVDDSYLKVLIVKSGKYKFALVVDEIVDSHEIVIKPLPQYIEALPAFSGATILGKGEVALIVDIGGLAEKVRLEEQEAHGVEQRALFRYDLDMQSFLWFDNGTSERFAIPLPFIQRIEKIESTMIQRVGNKEYYNYHDRALQVLRLENYLDIRAPEDGDQDLTLIIPKRVAFPICILIHRLLDTVDLPSTINQESTSESVVVGTTLIEGQLTLLLDMHAIIEKEYPSVTVPWNTRQAGYAVPPRILLAEDIAFFQVLTRNHLESMGFSVTVVADGVQALDRLSREKFHALITDIEMPIMNGWELMRHVREDPALSHLPVIAFTARSDYEECERGLQAGFTHWVTKMERSELVAALQEIFKKSAHAGKG